MRGLAKFSSPTWLVGVGLAIAGVSVARWVSPALAMPARSATEFAGEILALGGLGVIAWGISRRARAVPPA